MINLKGVSARDKALYGSFRLDREPSAGNTKYVRDLWQKWSQETLADQEKNQAMIASNAAKQAQTNSRAGTRAVDVDASRGTGSW